MIQSCIISDGGTDRAHYILSDFLTVAIDMFQETLFERAYLVLQGLDGSHKSFTLTSKMSCAGLKIESKGFLPLAASADSNAVHF